MYGKEVHAEIKGFGMKLINVHKRNVRRKIVFKPALTYINNIVKFSAIVKKYKKLHLRQLASSVSRSALRYQTSDNQDQGIPPVPRSPPKYQTSKNQDEGIPPVSRSPPRYQTSENQDGYATSIKVTTKVSDIREPRRVYHQNQCPHQGIRHRRTKMGIPLVSRSPPRYQTSENQDGYTTSINVPTKVLVIRV